MIVLRPGDQGFDDKVAIFGVERLFRSVASGQRDADADRDAVGTADVTVDGDGHLQLHAVADGRAAPSASARRGNARHLEATIRSLQTDDGSTLVLLGVFGSKLNADRKRHISTARSPIAPPRTGRGASLASTSSAGAVKPSQRRLPSVEAIEDEVVAASEKQSRDLERPVRDPVPAPAFAVSGQRCLGR